MKPAFILAATLLTPLAALHAAAQIPPPALWTDYDPGKGDFKEEIVRQETKDGVYYRDSYISAYVLDEEIRVFCRYAVKEGATKAPGLLNVHGWMGAPSPGRDFVEDGWAVMAHDYCGQTGDRPHYTKYPESLRHGNMDRNIAGPVWANTLDGESITDPKQTSDYIWYAIQRRVLSYLEQQKEVDRTRLGATGNSYGGTLMWNLATDPRVKAIVAYFGIGYNVYYRDHHVWMYENPPVDPPKKTPGEELYLASIAPQAHVPYIAAATLFLCLSPSVVDAGEAPTQPPAETDSPLHADGKGWRLDQAKIADPKRPRVLLIGDSLFNGFLPAAFLSFTTTEEVLLAADKQARLPIVVGERASERTKAAAQTLADYLRRISGAAFTVTNGDGAAGLVVGVPGDFAKLPFKTSFPDGSRGREDYLLRSAAGGVWLLGATDLAVQHAVWDLLYRLGYRQFFPGPVWEVIPTREQLSIKVDTNESPDFCSRRIWYNWGTLDYNAQPYADWCAKNRHAQGFRLNSGHAYGGIIGANKAEFDKHPEYYSLVDGRRRTGGDAKFCISNPGLRQLVVDWAVRSVKANPEVDSISMDPSDGDNWCQCEACAKLGSISDRALSLANDVAKAINQLGLGDRYVGMYAYNRHCPPPTIAVDPHVIISSTTAFITGGFTQEQIIDGWQAKGATIGIYDYYSVVDWDWNLPGRAKAARPHNVADSIRYFYNKGARFYDCESGDCWGPCGLGYYIAAQVMWDIAEADRVKDLTEDFLTRAFGPAKEAMRDYYNLLNFDGSPRPMSDLLGRLYRALAAARTAAAGRPDVLARVDQLILYTRYAELYNAQANGRGQRDEMLAFGWRQRKNMLIHVYGLWSVSIGQGAALDPKHPLKSDAAFTEQEIQTILQDGITNNRPVEMGFTPVAFSDNLVPSTPLKLSPVQAGSFPSVPQDKHRYQVWVPKAPAEFTLKVTVQHVWNLRPHKITLTSPLEVTGKPVDVSDIVRPDGRTYDVKLKTTHEGLHQVDVTDGGDYTRIVWPEGMPVTLPSAFDMPHVSSHFRGGWTLYCYVPKGTKVVGGWAARIAQWAPRISGVLKDGAGNVVFDFGKSEDGWFCVPVPAGQDGKLWKFENSQGTRQLMTIPPYLARTGAELLLPSEVVQKDAK